MHTNLHTGQAVYTADGDRLGEVKELRGDYFKIDAAMKPDYWLACDCVLGGMGGDDRVTLSFEKDRLADYKQKEPASF
jgi:hypothetical protein